MIDVNSRKNIHPVQQAVEESLYLENLLEDECKCEAAHQADGNETCSGKVTHRLMWDCRQESLVVCWNQFRYTASKLDGYQACRYCRRPTETCWSIRPV